MLSTDARDAVERTPQRASSPNDLRCEILRWYRDSNRKPSGKGSEKGASLDAEIATLKARLKGALAAALDN